MGSRKSDSAVVVASEETGPASSVTPVKSKGKKRKASEEIDIPIPTPHESEWITVKAVPSKPPLSSLSPVHDTMLPPATNDAEHSQLPVVLPNTAIENVNDAKHVESNAQDLLLQRGEDEWPRHHHVNTR